MEKFFLINISLCHDEIPQCKFNYFFLLFTLETVTESSDVEDGMGASLASPRRRQRLPQGP